MQLDLAKFEFCNSFNAANSIIFYANMLAYNSNLGLDRSWSPSIGAANQHESDKSAVDISCFRRAQIAPLSFNTIHGSNRTCKQPRQSPDPQTLSTDGAVIANELLAAAGTNESSNMRSDSRTSQRKCNQKQQSLEFSQFYSNERGKHLLLFYSTSSTGNGLAANQANRRPFRPTSARRTAFRHSLLFILG